MVSWHPSKVLARVRFSPGVFYLTTILQKNNKNNKILHFIIFIFIFILLQIMNNILYFLFFKL